MSEIIIDPTSLTVKDNNGGVRFDTSRQFPVILHQGVFQASSTGWFEVWCYNDPNNIAILNKYSSVSERILARKGVDYQATPDFVTGVVDISTSLGRVRTTVTGSVLVGFWYLSIPGADAIYSTSGAVSNSLADMTHVVIMSLYINGSGDLVLRQEFHNAKHMTSPNAGYGVNTVGWLTDDQIRSKFRYMGRQETYYDVYRYEYKIDRLDFIIGKFIG